MSVIASKAKHARSRAWGPWLLHVVRNKARGPVVATALLGASAASAADLDLPYGPPSEQAVAPVYIVPGPIVVAPAPVTLVVPRLAPLHYAPPPVYIEPPPLITALPIIGPYLVPPPATVLDAYDHRYDYNQ